jgi:hypothetical protein
MRSATKRWQSFKKELEDRDMAVKGIEETFPTLSMCFWPENYGIILEGLKSNSIPVTKVDYLFSSLVSDEEHWQRLQQLLDALRKSKTVNELRLSQQYDVLRKQYTLSTKNLKLFSSSKCKIKSLTIGISIEKSAMKLLTKELEKNTSIQKLEVLDAYGCLEALKTNKSITDLTVKSYRLDFCSTFAKALQANKSITSLTINENGMKMPHAELQELFSAMSQMSCLKYLKLTLAANQWPWEALTQVVKSNPLLTTLKLYSEWSGRDQENDLYKDQDLIVPALQSHPSLRYLSVSDLNFYTIVNALQNNSTITRLHVPVKMLVYDRSLMTLLTSIKNIQRLKLFHKGWTEPIFMNFLPLLKANWPLHTLILRFDWEARSSSNQDFFTELESHPCLEQLDFHATNSYLIEKCVRIRDNNPFLLLTARRKELYPNSTETRVKLKTMTCLLTFLRVILLTPEQGLMASLPREVLVLICQYFTASQYNVNQVLWLIDLVSGDRSHVVSLKGDIRQKLRSVWTKLSGLRTRSQIEIVE